MDWRTRCADLGPDGQATCRGSSPRLHLGRAGSPAAACRHHASGRAERRRLAAGRPGRSVPVALDEGCNRAWSRRSAASARRRMISRWRWVHRKWCCRGRIVRARRRPLPRAGCSGFWPSHRSAAGGDACAGRAATHLLAHVRTLDQGPSTPTASRPEPKRPPESSSRKPTPSRRLATLRRDPYAIYARRVLAPRSAGAVPADPGPRERGTLYHAILEQFISANRRRVHRTLEALREIAAAHFRMRSLPDATALVWRIAL
jgi:hypothetical protein